MARQYDYVGPEPIRQRAQRAPPGVRITSLRDLHDWVRSTGPGFCEEPCSRDAVAAGLDRIRVRRGRGGLELRQVSEGCRPMEQVQFGRWTLTFGPEATRRAYEAIPTGGPEQCGCSPCRNFAEARDRVYPADALALFARLGVDPRKEAEVYHLARLRPGLHLYGGFLHLVGSLVDGADALRPGGAIDLEPVTEGFSIGFTSRASLVPDPFAGQAVVQLEFAAQVPWLLAEPEPD